ncbi:MAG: CoA ester lyase [Novosphingobium sp. 28-62-57]|uniref:HpcH/HpaI aldolase/citrate lyase family protein n=1 Tax=unclassified Novosphingobium TaxID=2644732 RepID=UPI000BDCA240|nr:MULTISPECIES: CoA ester lyase [unclassified Novosphingobium]OYW50214.1 MAG: CoA ester lyase [Novosphingobium sp. 12-62-10]OYZ11680.1 MAG: CoA ester lyase [Novosphingobium sp. 28-62-57]OZA36710.1 MAG: CoA ester lyase [Novosphingobium sp. 17-62-9]HQS69460.1 CoA ester lyase [Novosphingobium sp.]
MPPRSWLFVPGDSEKKLGKAMSTGAHAVIVDLEDAVAPAAKPHARILARDWLAAHRHHLTESKPVARWVRINAFDTGVWQDDLATVMAGAPDGVMLPKCEGPEQLRQLAAEIYEMEQRHRLANGSTRILPLVSETARSALTIPAYADAPMPRLAGLTWGAEDLSAVLGATRKRDADGAWTDAFRFIRAQCLLVAHARSVWAIDTLNDDFRNEAATKRAAEAARADGFTGMLAIHPSQVPIINAAFAPTEAELAEAKAILALFDENPDAGTLQYNGRMIDQPHLRMARQLLGSA